MSKQQKVIINTDFSGDFFDFYKMLGWDTKKYLNPTKVKISKEMWDHLYDKTFEIYKQKDPTMEESTFGMFFINYSPSVDSKLKFNEVILLPGWVE